MATREQGKTTENPRVLRNVCKCIYLPQSGRSRETFGKRK